MARCLRNASAVAAIFAGLALAGPAQATFFYLSTFTGASLGGLSFQDGDVARYDRLTDTATLSFDESLFLGNETVDAFSRLGNGNFVLSTANAASLGGLAFSDGDLVEYNPLTDVATLFFDENLFSNDADIDAAHVLGDGRMLLSADNTETLGGLTFRNGDVVLYDPATDTATLLFDQDLFSQAENIDALSMLADGSLVLSTVNGGTLGGLTFRDGDLVQYDLGSGLATLFFDEDLFGGNENINALMVPEPGSAALLALGLAGIAAARNRRRGVSS